MSNFRRECLGTDMRIDWYHFRSLAFDPGDDGVFVDTQNPSNILNATAIQHHVDHLVLDARFITAVSTVSHENSSAGFATKSRATTLGAIPNYFRRFAIPA